MMRWSSSIAILSLTFLFHATSGSAQVTTEQFNPVPGDPTLNLGTYTHPAGGKTLNLTVGIGSGAFRGSQDRRTTFWTVSDRGPNFTCDEASDVIEISSDIACLAIGDVDAGEGRLYPLPTYTPSIYRVQLSRNHTFQIIETIPLCTLDGTPITGLPNPLLTATTETPRDGAGNILSQDASAVDAEGIVPLPKTQRLIAASLEGADPRFPQKLEGLALTRDKNLFVINDNDFGITDQTTQIDIVSGTGIGQRRGQ